MTTRMTDAERDAFLADVHVGVLSMNEPDRGPLTAPIWYAYEPGGEVILMTGPNSRKGRLLAVGTRVSLCAQTEAPPYAYVTVEGPVTAIEPPDADVDMRPMAIRYLGPELGAQYAAAMALAEDDSVMVRIRPEHWLTVDYAKDNPLEGGSSS